MSKKELLLITSKVSGPQVDLLPQFESILRKHKITYDSQRLSTPPEIEKYIQSNKDGYQVVAVYGGDGSIVAAMKALLDTKTKLLVLSGGTANIIAGELKLPTGALEVLKMYAQRRYVTEYYDVASINDQPLILDMHSGWWTEAIKKTSRVLKKKYGPIAYGMSAIKELPAAKKEHYELTVGAKRKKVSGYTLLIANRGQQGFLGVNLFPHKHRSGILQVAIIKRLTPAWIFIWLVGRVLGKNLGSVVKTYRSPNLIIHKSPKEFVIDDFGQSVKLPLTINGAKHVVPVLVSPHAQTVTFWKRIALFASINAVRFKERLRNLVTGQPSFVYSQITPRLYLGGTYRSGAFKQFRAWGVTGVVNMRSSVLRSNNPDFEVLHLKTRDWTPPSLEDFTKGVDFMNKKIEAGGSVYVHCRQGEGRGPSMAAAYLISQGLTLEEAIAVMKKSRPVVHPNRSQVKRLSEWQAHLSDSK